jgi:UDP-glucose 4-epimerase
MKKALITGGAGFIGSNIVKRLLEIGIESVVLDNLSSGYRVNLLQGAKFVEGDVRDKERIEQAIVGCDFIFHLAASVGNKRSIDDPSSDSAVNLLGTINILETAKNHGIKRIVFSSSAGVYGEPDSLPIREAHPQNPDSPYGTSKLAAEKMCLVYNRSLRHA